MSAGEFVGQLLHGATIAHVFHLRSRFYAQHVALGELYDGLSDVADKYAEAYQGAYGLIQDYPPQFALPDGEPAAWVQSLSQFIDQSRAGLPADSELMNIVDEAQALVNTAHYKLTFLA